MPLDSLAPARFVERPMCVRWIVAGLFVVSMFGTEMPSEVRRLAGLAASLPPEFQADALLQIVETRGGLNAAQKMDLLEQAATLAQQAKYAYPKMTATAINADSRQAFEANALALKLDRLSLETRSIRDLLALDPIAARRLFQQTQKPAPPPGTCADALVPLLDDYYDVAIHVISRGFSAKEIDREDHVALTLQIVAGVKMPYEIAPAARMIAGARLTPLQFEAALNAFTSRLEATTPDDRAFSETGLAVQQEIASLAAHATSLGVSRGTLARAYRKYLTSNYSGPRCADSANARIAGTAVNSPVEWFNQSDLRGDLAVIAMKELKAKDAEGTLQVNAFWSTPDSEKILVSAQALRLSAGGVPFSMQDRASTEWNQKLQDFLAQLNNWKQSGVETELDFFNQKATVYESLIDVYPSGDGRQRMIGAFVEFLKSSTVLDHSPVNWFWHAQNMYRRLRQGGDADAKKLMAAYKASGSLMLEVYAQFNVQ